MENNFKVLLNNAFLHNRTGHALVKNYPDLVDEELEVFEIFLRQCYKKINYRNKESWWKYENGNTKLKTEAARFFEKEKIWHLHINKNLSENNLGKTINYEIYPGNTAKYVIFYSKEEKNLITSINILSFSKHPHDVTWQEVANFMGNSLI